MDLFQIHNGLENHIKKGLYNQYHEMIFLKIIERDFEQWLKNIIKTKN